MADHYKVLGVSPSATDAEIKQAYRRRSLETHPDRFAVGSREQEEATALFQEVNNAYYALSDPERRRDYDSKRSSGNAAGGGSGSSWFRSASPKDHETSANEQFGSFFEEMMAEEGLNESYKGKFYGMAGGAAGAVLGFIVANVPGALGGAVAGYKLGNIRDTTGKAVYEVFQELPHAEKAKMISVMLAKVMAQLS